MSDQTKSGTEAALRDTRPQMALLVLTLVRIPIALGLLLYLRYSEVDLMVIVISIIALSVIELTDFLDGFLARRHRITSELGATLDPYADSIARLLTYSALAVADLSLLVVPLAMALRDITVAYTRVMAARSGRTASARWSGKIKAVVQGVGAYLLLLGPLYWDYTGVAAVDWISWTVAIATLLSAVEYIVGALKAQGGFGEVAPR